MGGRLKFYHLFSFVDSARGSLAHGMAPHTHMAEAYLLQWKCIYGGWRASQNASGPWCLIPFIVIINHFVNNLFDIATIKFAYQREILQACVYRYWFDDVVWCDWLDVKSMLWIWTIVTKVRYKHVIYQYVYGQQTQGLIGLQRNYLKL